MNSNKTQQLPLRSRTKAKLDIKSPIFTPRPGWGGKLKKWLKRNYSSRILPAISLLTFAIGLYLITK